MATGEPRSTPATHLRDAYGALDLAGRVAIVTGAASGIGLAISRRLAFEGAHVVMVDLFGDRLDAAIAGLRSLDLDVEGVVADVADEAALESLADRAFMAGPVGVVCLNAGVPGPLGERTWEVPIAEWEPTIRVNMWAPIIGSVVFLRRLVEQESASHLVFTVSMAGVFTSSLSAPYFASKHAVYALAATLRDQLAATPVRVSAICPGAVQTPLLETIRSDMRDATERGALASDGRVDPRRRTLAPSQVADDLAAALGTSRFHVMMNPEYRQYYEDQYAYTVGEWPDAPPADSVLPAVARLLAGFRSAELDQVREAFRGDATQGDSEPVGLGETPLTRVADTVRELRFAYGVQGLEGGRAEVRWSAISRATGALVAEGTDVFSGDATSIWRVMSDQRLVALHAPGRS